MKKYNVMYRTSLSIWYRIAAVNQLCWWPTYVIVVFFVTCESAADFADSLTLNSNFYHKLLYIVATCERSYVR